MPSGLDTVLVPSAGKSASGPSEMWENLPPKVSSFEHTPISVLQTLAVFKPNTLLWQLSDATKLHWQKMLSVSLAHWRFLT